MNRILKSGLIIVAVAAVAAGASWSYFTDTETVEDMTFATGTLSIDDVSASWMTTVNFDNLKPGDSIRKWIKLENDGTLDIESLLVNALNKTGDTDLLDHITVTIYGTVDGYDQGIYTPDWGHGQPVNSWLNDINILGTAEYRDATAAHVLAPGEVDTIILDFRVPTDLGNEWQEKNTSFDLEFEAEQSHTGTQYF